MIRLREVVNLVKELSPGKRVADFACAQGNFGLLLAEDGFDVTAIDIKTEFLQYAMKKYERGQFRVIETNIIDFRDAEGFDCILAGEIIEHCAHPDQLLASIHANLKPGGIVVLTTPNGNEFGSRLPTYSQVTDISALIPKQFHWGDHLFLFTIEELRSLFVRQGFRMLREIKFHSQYISQLKGPRYLLPLRALEWMEKRTRHLKKRGKDSAGHLIVVARK